MNEVSLRATQVLLEAAARCEVQPESVLADLPLTMAQLLLGHWRIAWDLHVEILDRLERLFGHPERFEAVGMQFPAVPAYPNLRAMATLFTRPQQIYWAMCRWGGPASFSHARFRYSKVDNGLRIDIRIPDSHRGSAAFFHVATGLMRVLPRYLGCADDARVESDIGSHCGTYHIVPPASLPRQGRLRTVVHRLAGARAAIEELAAQQEELQTSHRQLAEAHQRLAAQQTEFNLVMDNAHDLVALLNADGTVRFASPSHRAILGYTPKSLVGRNVLSFVHPEDVGRVLDAFSEAMRTTAAAPPIEFRFRHRNGSWRLIEAFGTSLLQDGVLTGVISSRDVTDRKRAEQHTQILLDVAHSVSAQLDLQSLLDSIQGQIAEALGCDRVATYCHDSARGGFCLAAQHGTPAELLQNMRAAVFPPGEPFGGRALRGETLVCNDIAAQPFLSPDACRHASIAAFAVAPLRVRDRHLGVIVVINATPDRPFDDHQVRLLEGIARQVSVAIEAAELYAAQQAEAEISTALAQISREMIGATTQPEALQRLCELTTEVLGCDYSHTWLTEEGGNSFICAAAYGDQKDQLEMLRALHLPRPVLEPLFAAFTRDDLIIPMKSETPVRRASDGNPFGMNTAMLVALRRGTEIFGFHTAGFHRPAPELSPQRQRLARGIAQIAALAVDHVRVVDELARANRLKSDFVATMSHELRTPLNVIIGYTDLLREEAFGPLNADQAQTLGRVNLRARELLELISATLDFSRLESGRLRLTVDRVRVDDLIREIDAETSDGRNRPGLEFTWQVEQPLPDLLTDALKLKVVLKNLIGNAVKFTPLGRVTFAARPLDGGVEFTIADTGVGIHAEALPVIFEPFRQGHGGVAREFGGVGLGLYIVRQLLTLLGGSVHVESAPGRGSTFRVRLPQSCPSPPNDATKVES